MTVLSTRVTLQTEDQSIYYTVLSIPLKVLILVYKVGDVEVKD